MRQSPVHFSSSLPKPDLNKLDSNKLDSEAKAIVFTVHGRWVPGTLDRVTLERQDSAKSGSLEVHHNRVHQLFGRGAMDPLYLTGKSRFECTLEEWTALEA